MKTNIRRRICISAAYLERIRSQKRKSHPEGQRRAPSPTIQSTHQSANHTVFTPKTDPDHTDSGGLKPTAINPEHWDLVPPSGAHRLPPKCDGVWAIRRHKQPSGRALRRASAAGKSSWQRALTAFCPTFVLQRENQPVKAGHGSCAFAQPHWRGNGRARAGSPIVKVTSGTRRQTSACQSQKKVAFQRRMGAAGRLRGHQRGSPQKPTYRDDACRKKNQSPHPLFLYTPLLLWGLSQRPPAHLS